MIPLMRYLELSQIHRDRMQNGCQLVGRLNGELLFNEHRVLVLQDKTALEVVTQQCECT